MQPKRNALKPLLLALSLSLTACATTSPPAEPVKPPQIPPPPPELNMQQLNIKFVSMLAQAQRAIGTNSIDRYVGSLGAVAQFKPDVLDKFDSDAWADAYAEMLGVDPTMIVPSKDAALVRDNRAQMQARAQQSALQNQAADTAQKLAQVPTQGGQSNAAYDVMNQVSGYTSPSPERI